MDELHQPLLLLNHSAICLYTIRICREWKSNVVHNTLTHSTKFYWVSKSNVWYPLYTFLSFSLIRVNAVRIRHQYRWVVGDDHSISSCALMKEKETNIHSNVQQISVELQTCGRNIVWLAFIHVENCYLVLCFNSIQRE